VEHRLRAQIIVLHMETGPSAGADGVVHRLTAKGDALVATTGDALAATARAVRALARPSGLRAALVEAAWLAAHAALYPWGVLTQQLSPHADGHYRTETLSTVQRGLLVVDVQAAGTPILLVHGIGDNRSAFTVLRRALRRRGFGVVHGVNYSVLTAITGDVRAAARSLGREIERVCEETGAEQVHVVGHSLGGVLARYYVQRLGGDARVHTLVTLGSPHGGTLAAYLLPTPIARQLRPDADVIAELAEPAPACRTRFLVVWSELDQVVVPQRHARLEHPDLTVTHLRLSDVGHLSLSVDSRVVHAVVSTLSQLSGSDPAAGGRGETHPGDTPRSELPAGGPRR